MKSDGNKKWIVGAGLVAGFALGYYLNSKEGREWRKRTMDQLDEYGNEISGIASEVSQLAGNYADQAAAKGHEWTEAVANKGQELVSKARETVDQSKGWVSETSSSVASKIVKGKEVAEDKAKEVESSFKRGVNKAKRKSDPNGKV